MYTTSGNGKIDFKEFLTMVQFHVDSAPEEVEMRQMFAAFDKVSSIQTTCSPCVV